MALSYDDLSQFIEDELAVDAELSPDTPLFTSGLIDSFSLVSLMTYIELKTRTPITAEDVNLANFDTIGRILRYVHRSAAVA
jgi:acyl carrier protein/D-alanine--poly(phosphoribitol) ligase subunit 2